MEILLEILLDVYGELMLLIVPEKGMRKKYIILSKIFAILVLMGGIALVLWGIYLIADQDNLLRRDLSRVFSAKVAKTLNIFLLALVSLRNEG